MAVIGSDRADLGSDARNGPPGLPDGGQPTDDAAGSGQRAYGGKRTAGRAADLPGEPEPGSDGQPDRAAQTDPQERARQICLRMLTSAPRTRAELGRALSRRGIPAEAAEEVLGRFTDAGLIDDATFASAWVESRHHSRGLAGRALAAELTRRGVSSGDIQAAIGALPPDQEVTTARALVARRLAGTKDTDPQARTRRLIGMLARRGYPAALAFRVVREALEQEGTDPAEAGLTLDDPPETGQDDGW